MTGIAAIAATFGPGLISGCSCASVRACPGAPPPCLCASYANVNALPPACAAFSNTTNSNPSVWCSAHAATRPDGPPPTMATRVGGAPGFGAGHPRSGASAFCASHRGCSAVLVSVWHASCTASLPRLSRPSSSRRGSPARRIVAKCGRSASRAGPIAWMEAAMRRCVARSSEFSRAAALATPPSSSSPSWLSAAASPSVPTRVMWSFSSASAIV